MQREGAMGLVMERDTLRTLPLLLLTGCGLGLSNYTPSDSAQDADTALVSPTQDTAVPEDTAAPEDTGPVIDPTLETLEVVSVDPPYGTTAGGQEVTLLGGPFDSSAVVSIGGQEAGVRSISSDRIVAITPAGSSGAVDVTVTTDTHGGYLAEGFTYYADGTGLAGAVGVVSWTEYVGGYWSGSTPGTGTAQVTLVDPMDFHWWELTAGAMDTCVDYNTYSYSGEIYVWDLEVGSLTLTPAGGSAMDLSFSESSLFFELAELSESQHVDNALYSLSPLSAGPLAGLSVEGLLQTAGQVQVSEPAILGNQAPSISRSQSVRWTAGSADWIVIYVAMLDAQQQNFEQIIACVAADDGVFQIDGSLFTSWPTGRQVNFYFTPVREHTQTLPHNNSQSRITGMYQMVGAGFSQ